MWRLPRDPRFWLASFLIWFVVLWGLSSFKVPSEGVPPIQHLDKIVHFGYFFGGSGLLSAYQFRRRPERPDWRKVIAISVAVVGIVGALDEWHQSFTPGRSGNDPFDLAADFLGALAGAFTFKALHRKLE